MFDVPFLYLVQFFIFNWWQSSTSEEATFTNPTAIKPEEYFNNLIPLENRDVGRPKEVSTKIQKFRATLWLSEDHPLSMQEQVLPIIDLMAISNAHFAKLRDFITLQLPAGFPIKIGMYHCGVKGDWSAFWQTAVSVIVIYLCIKLWITWSISKCVSDCGSSVFVFYCVWDPCIRLLNCLYTSLEKCNDQFPLSILGIFVCFRNNSVNKTDATWNDNFLLITMPLRYLLSWFFPS